MDTRDRFHRMDAGDVDIEVNTKSMTSDRYVDRSRIGSHDEWQFDPKKGGKMVQVPDSMMDNARRGMDAMKHRSVFSDAGKTRGDGNQCCAYGYGEGPLNRRRGDD